MLTTDETAETLGVPGSRVVLINDISPITRYKFVSQQVSTRHMSRILQTNVFLEDLFPFFRIVIRMVPQKTT